jgi:hypothetical protein
MDIPFPVSQFSNTAYSHVMKSQAKHEAEMSTVCAQHVNSLGISTHIPHTHLVSTHITPLVLEASTPIQ